MEPVSLDESAAQLSKDESEDSSDDFCAICFEQGPFVTLPCACAVKYCSGCWDRALASSVTIRGRAQCPSCRAAFKVDYDVNASSLVFTTDAEGTPATDWRAKLYGKVKGVQIKMLEAYKEDFAGKDVEVDPDHDSEHTCQMHPHCVCGAELEHVSSQARILRLLEDMEPGWRSRVVQPEDMVRRLIDSALVTCDLCDSVALQGPGGEKRGVWTCKNGPHTVMHPCAYDVCEDCFEKYAGSSCTVPLPEDNVSSKPKAPLISWNPQRLGVGCCQACSAVLNAMPRPWNRRRRLWQQTL
eukprot:TRINITY_DN23005_c0_g1_i2.p1 TRINITY_DN23005_c0_g1~~TRINITY_DN23005_c0_g1_i2.p1  ORF type:complete len:316 (+),score=54.59 TRINITY_DN23005_c0_g1_i2:56-949(+)